MGRRGIPPHLPFASESRQAGVLFTAPPFRTTLQFVMTQDSCELCAVSLAQVRDATCRLLHKQTEIGSRSPLTLDNMLHEIARAERTGDSGFSLLSADRSGRIVVDGLPCGRRAEECAS